MEVLKQPQYSPYSMEEQYAILFLAVNAYLMDIKIEKVKPFVKEYLEYIKNEKMQLLDSISKTGVVSVEQEGEFHAAAAAFKGIFK